MLLVDKMLAEMTEEETEFLTPGDYEDLKGYFFEMEYVGNNGNWVGYVILPNDEEVKIIYYNDTGNLKYEKGTAYYQMVEDANRAFPMNSCAIDTMSALLMIAEAQGWDDGND